MCAGGGGASRRSHAGLKLTRCSEKHQRDLNGDGKVLKRTKVPGSHTDVTDLSSFIIVIDIIIINGESCTCIRKVMFWLEIKCKDFLRFFQVGQRR